MDIQETQSSHGGLGVLSRSGDTRHTGTGGCEHDSTASAAAVKWSKVEDTRS